jgi:Tol biopolymer transport system component
VAPLVAVMAAALAACAPTTSLPGRGETALVVSDRAGVWRIYEVGLDDGSARLIGSPTAGDPAPGRAPRGAAGPGGATYEDSMPARLPDGRVAFVSDRDGNPEIYLAPVDGGPILRLTRDGEDGDPAAADSAPSPLGRDRIVFARTAPGAPASAPRDLYVMRADGSAMRRITRHPADDRTPAGSADGRSVVFVSERSGVPRLFLIPDVDAADPEAAVVDLSGPAPPGPAATGDGSPAWLPDGSIVFSRISGGTPQIALVGPEGGRRGVRQITEPLTLPYGADEPVALSDGTLLLVTGPVPGPAGSTAEVRFAVYRIGAGGINLTRVTRDPAPYDDFTRRLSAH